jgi:hypothetical protein
MTERQQLDAELTAILVHLPGWKLDPQYANSWAAGLIDGMGREIHINPVKAKGRLYLSGFWPKDKHGNQLVPVSAPHATISRDRPPEKIAADILRRFLPKYQDAYAPLLAEIKRTEERENRREAIAKELAALTPGGELYGNCIRVTVNFDSTVSITIDYKSLKVAKAVLAALKKSGAFEETA